jgi:hypothetical protein
LSGAADTSLRERPIGELMKQLAEETGTLVRQEVQLAKAEMLEKIELVRGDLEQRGERAKEALARDGQEIKDGLATTGKQAGVGVGFFGAAGAVALIALGILAALLVRVLDAVMPSWVALVLVLVLYLATAGLLALAGREKLRRAADSLPRHGLEQMKRDATRLVAPGRLKEAWPPVPEQTIETLKEDVEWAKHPKSSATR